MGAVTATNIKHSVFGDRRFVTADVTLSASYAVGGETGLLALMGLKSTDWLKCENMDGLIFEWDETNGLLLALFPTGGGATAPTTLIQPDATVDAGATPVTSSAANGAIATVTPGISKEVAATADLSAVTTRISAVGI